MYRLVGKRWWYEGGEGRGSAATARGWCEVRCSPALEGNAPMTVTSVIIFELRSMLFSPSKNIPNVQDDRTAFY